MMAPYKVQKVFNDVLQLTKVRNLKMFTHLKSLVAETPLPARNQSVVNVYIEDGVEKLLLLLALVQQMHFQRFICRRLIHTTK